MNVQRSENENVDTERQMLRMQAKQIILAL